MSFAVPKYITERHGGSNFGGWSGVAQTITKYSTGGETLGNGKAAAHEAADGFIDAMARSGRWQIMPLEKVARNDEIRGMARLYNQNRNNSMAGVDGLPIIRLRMESQCHQIELYRLHEMREAGRELTLDEAAFEWIERYADTFDRDYEFCLG